VLDTIEGHLLEATPKNNQKSFFPVLIFSRKRLEQNILKN
jgi:hypothetical protein